MRASVLSVRVRAWHCRRRSGSKRFHPVFGLSKLSLSCLFCKKDGGLSGKIGGVFLAHFGREILCSYDAIGTTGKCKRAQAGDGIRLEIGDFPIDYEQ